MLKNFLIVDMRKAEPGKPFEGMAAGEFTSMSGRKASFAKNDLPAYVSNTQRALESTRDSNGDIVGLPIDGKNHDHGDAAGWVVAVELSEDEEKIMFTPRWTDFGRELIANDIQRFFSPTVDTDNKVIMGGSLTNWPATRLDNGEILLRPVELSLGLALPETSLDEQGMKVREAFYGGYGYDSYCVEVFTDYLIAIYEGQMYKVNYAENADGEIVFTPMAEWAKVKHTYVETAMNFVKSLFKPFFNGGENATPPAEHTPEGETMTNLTIADHLAALTQSDEGKAELARLAQAQADAIVAQERRKSAVAEFALSVTSGRDSGKGLPVTATELEAVLLSLPDEAAEKVEDLLKKVLDNALVDFAEHGHARSVNKRELPAEFATILKLWVDAGKSVEDWFAVNPEVGLMADYNVTAFTKEQ